MFRVLLDVDGAWSVDAAPRGSPERPTPVARLWRLHAAVAAMLDVEPDAFEVTAG